MQGQALWASTVPFSSLLGTFAISGRAAAWNPAGTPTASHPTVQS
jgi:hypothetical protein